MFIKNRNKTWYEKKRDMKKKTWYEKKTIAKNIDFPVKIAILSDFDDFCANRAFDRI